MQLSRGDRPTAARAVPAEMRADDVRADEAPVDQRRWSLWIAATYLAIATALALVATLGARFPIKLLPGAEAETGVPWLDAWFRWDSGWYYSIAVDGYFFADGQQSPVAFFPTYPLAMRVVADAVGNVALAGVLITVVSGLGAVLLFWHWCSWRLSRRAALIAVALLLVYPYSLFLYGAVYADALFLLTAIGAFVLLERGHPWLAGLVGALATAGRPVGLAVAVGLIIRAVELSAARRRAANGATSTGQQPPALPTTATLRERMEALTRSARDALRTVRLRDAGVLLSVLGLVGYSGYLAMAFGNLFAFADTQASPGWDQGSGPRTWFKIAFLGTLINGPWHVAVKLLIPALFCLAGLLLTWRVWRRFGSGYAAYAFLMVAVPAISTKDFMGTGRYLLAAFPVFAAAGELLDGTRRRWLLPVIFGTGALGLVAAAYLYGTAYQIS